MNTSTLDSEYGDAGLVYGVYCRKKHFNDPSIPFCSVCGISMMQSTRRSAVSRRVPVGILIFADGSDLPIDRSVVLGSEPGRDPRVAVGEVGGIRLVDRWSSPVHATLVVREWQVWLVDEKSEHGTYVCHRGGSSWSRIETGSMTQIVSGMNLLIGSCVFTYEARGANDLLELEAERRR